MTSHPVEQFFQVDRLDGIQFRLAFQFSHSVVDRGFQARTGGAKNKVTGRRVNLANHVAFFVRLCHDSTTVVFDHSHQSQTIRFAVSVQVKNACQRNWNPVARIPCWSHNIVTLFDGLDEVFFGDSSDRSVRSGDGKHFDFCLLLIQLKVVDGIVVNGKRHIGSQTVSLTNVQKYVVASDSQDLTIGQVKILSSQAIDANFVVAL